MMKRQALAVVVLTGALFAAVHSAVIPTIMFANRPGGSAAFNAQRQQALSPSRHWQRVQQATYNPWNDGSETYGYVSDRHPSSSGVIDDLTAVLQQQQQQQQMPLVYGVPHRYLSDPAPEYVLPAATDDLYENPLFYAHPFNVLKRSGSALSPAALASYYDLLDSADNEADVEDSVADDYETPLSRQDVINFEKYVQRYFQQPDDPQQYADDWTAPNSGLANDDVNYDVQNDEEAARQLHLLLRQPPRRPVIATREISKKSLKESVSKIPTSAKTSTTATSTTTTTTTQAPTTVYGQPVHYQRQGQRQGQKEEPMLRPPTPQRHSTSSPAPSVAPTDKADANIYHTIQRLMTMHSHLSQPDQKDISEAQSSAEVELEDASGRQKRFVAASQESLLNQQIHALDKIKA